VALPDSNNLSSICHILNARVRRVVVRDALTRL
jgi:hypothetical protein